VPPAAPPTLGLPLPLLLRHHLPLASSPPLPDQRRRGRAGDARERLLLRHGLRRSRGRAPGGAAHEPRGSGADPRPQRPRPPRGQVLQSDTQPRAQRCCAPCGRMSECKT
jgi:hypothetical protein